MKCPLCSYEFGQDEGTISCTGCVFLSGCRKVCCPNCRYEIPRESKLIKYFKKRRKVKNECK